MILVGHGQGTTPPAGWLCIDIAYREFPQSTQQEIADLAPCSRG